MRRRFVLLLVLVALGVGACRKSPTEPTPPEPPTPTPARPTASILCNNQSQSCSIGFDLSTTISWTCANSASGSVTGTSWTGTTGSQSTGRLTSSRDYELKCVGTNGETVTATVKVNVSSQPLPLGFTLSGNCTTVDSKTQRANLSWTESANAIGYRVERRIWSSGSWASVQSTTNRTYSEVVPSDADYYWRVYSINSTGTQISTPTELQVCANTIPPTPPPPSIPGGPGTPEIRLSFVPAKGSFENLRGTVLHVVPADHKVACWINVFGVWYPKPTYQNPVVGIDSGGNWSCDITTGGIDEQATVIEAYLVTNAYVSSNRPSKNGVDVLEVAVASR